MMVTSGKLIGACGDIFVVVKRIHNGVQLLQFNVQDVNFYTNRAISMKGKFLRNGRVFSSHGQAQKYVKKYLKQFGWIPNHVKRGWK